MSVAGAMMFARFAAPPNGHGYCGPDAHDTLAAYASGEIAPDAGLRELATAFEGAWPWLELLAGAGHADPLDERVVEAYWLGNDLITNVAANDLGNHLVDRFHGRAGDRHDHVVAGVGTGAVANHAFHVFGVYPWVGLLRDGRGGEIALGVLESCRVSWGRVISLDGDSAVVMAAPLCWDGTSLSLGTPRPRTVRTGGSGFDIAGNDGDGDGSSYPGRPLSVGSTVALHWDTICATLTPRRLGWLRAVTHGQIALANTTGIAAVL
ncbi:MAG: DUF6390 family protein [Acidimicrobiales bacterium]